MATEERLASHQSMQQQGGWKAMLPCWLHVLRWYMDPGMRCRQSFFCPICTRAPSISSTCKSRAQMRQ